MSTNEDWAEGDVPPEDWVGDTTGGSGLDPMTEGETDALVSEVHQKAARFMRKNGLTLDIAGLDKREVDEAIRGLLTEVEDMSYGTLMAHRIGDELPANLSFLLFYATVAARYRLLISKPLTQEQP